MSVEGLGPKERVCQTVSSEGCERVVVYVLVLAIDFPQRREAIQLQGKKVR